MLTVDGKEYTQTLRLQFDPSVSVSSILSASSQAEAEGGEEEEGEARPPVDP